MLRLSAACATAVLLASGGAGAQVDARLADCARITGSSERLDCYDALSKARRSTASDDFWNHAFGQDKTGKSPATAQPGDADTVTEFGFDDAKSGDGPRQLDSRYDGEFTGWSGNTLFRLENGQVWKQAQPGRVNVRATRPKVTIKRAALGGYRMNVEGLSESIRVERVK